MRSSQYYRKISHRIHHLIVICIFFSYYRFLIRTLCIPWFCLLTFISIVPFTVSGMTMQGLTFLLIFLTNDLTRLNIESSLSFRYQFSILMLLYAQILFLHQFLGIRTVTRIFIHWFWMSSINKFNNGQSTRILSFSITITFLSRFSKLPYTLVRMFSYAYWLLIGIILFEVYHSWLNWVLSRCSLHFRLRFDEIGAYLTDDLLLANSIKIRMF